MLRLLASQGKSQNVRRVVIKHLDQLTLFLPLKTHAHNLFTHLPLAVFRGMVCWLFLKTLLCLFSSWSGTSLLFWISIFSWDARCLFSAMISWKLFTLTSCVPRRSAAAAWLKNRIVVKGIYKELLAFWLKQSHLCPTARLTNKLQQFILIKIHVQHLLICEKCSSSITR